MSQYIFDEEAANRPIDFIETFLTHSKGKWAGEPFLLQDWQKEIFRSIFGWLDPQGRRKYRKAYIEVPRKNGKSTLGAAVALYLLFADKEAGAEIYSVASKREQAGIIFEQARAMVMASPELLQRATVQVKQITIPSTLSTYKVLSSDVSGQHGQNSHGIIFDELHTQPNRRMWDVMNTSMGARTSPLFFQITTAGFDRTSICYEQHKYAKQVAEGVIEDEQYFSYIAGIEEGDDWTDPENWAKANPSLGVTIQPDYIRRECEMAKVSATYQNTFRQLFLNQWTSQDVAWLKMIDWDRGNAALPDLQGQPCYAGLDLATTTDIAAFVLVFPQDGDYYIKPFLFMPADNIEERGRSDGVPYSSWASQGHVILTPGNVIDYAKIKEVIFQAASDYAVREIAFDIWGATQITQELDAAFQDTSLVPFSQGMRSLSPPSKELERLVLSGRLIHGGHPVLRWMADNVVVEKDSQENIRPSKKKSSKKIDGIVATIMGLDRATRHGVTQVDSVYKERGILYL